MTLLTDISIGVNAVRSDTLDLGTNTARHALELALRWASGTGSSEADAVWSDTRTVNAAAHDNLDLTSLTQVDSSGTTVRTVAFAVIKAILIVNTSTSGYLAVGGGTDGAAAADAWALATAPFSTDASIGHIPFGGAWFWCDPTGVAVTNTSADVFRIGGVSANQTYKIVIIGEST